MSTLFYHKKKRTNPPLGNISLFVFSFFIFCALPARAATIVKQPNSLGLVGYWSFNEGKLTSATDFSGKGNVGTLTNMESSDWINGKIGKALDFGGTDEYVDVGNSASLTAGVSSTNHSIFAWVKTTATGRNAILAASDTSAGPAVFNGSPGIAFGDSGTRLQLYIGSGGGGNWRYSSTNISDGVWHHVGYTIDSSYNLTFYLDGATNGTSTNSSGFQFPAGNKFVIGTDWYSNAVYSPFMGSVDEVRVYSRALSATEVASLYALTRKAVTGRQSYNDGLVFYAPLDDASGAIARNYGGSGRNGALTNFALTGSTSNWASGKRNGALNFDATNDIVNFGNNAKLAMRSNLSIFAWVKTSSTYQSIVSWGSSGTGGVANGNYGLGSFGTLCGGGGRLAVYVGSSWRCGSTSIHDGSWHHVGYTFDSAGNLQYYFDGVTDGSAIATGSQFSNSPNNELIFGADDGSTSYNFPYGGTLDEVRVYNRVLSSSEVAAIYNDTGLHKVVQGKSMNSVAPSNLVLWHTFDGPYLNTSTSTDRSGRGNDGSLTSSPVPVTGKIGQAIKFNGSSNYVNVPNSSSVDLTGNMSISMWIRPSELIDSSSGRKDLLVKFLQYWLILNYPSNDGKILFAVSTGSPAVYTTTTSWKANTWYHLAATWDGTNFKIYVDGVLENTASGSAPPSTSTSVQIGGNSVQSNYFPGSIDDVRIYNKSLSSAEVLQLYNLGR